MPLILLAQDLSIFCMRWIILEEYIKNPHFMKLNRKEYDLVYDAFQYMQFKMTKEQRELSEQILDRAFTREVA